jgi:predicted O-methyltransferase YrrM
LIRDFCAFRYGTAYRLILMRMARRHGWRSFLEVGVRLGHTGVFLLSNVRDLHYHGVDPFLDIVGDPEEPGFTNYGSPDMSKWYRRASKELARFGGRAELSRTTSLAKAAETAPASIDCVFIDGDHRKDAVLADIDAWFPKVKPGGFLIGHDWKWPSVREAVTERFPAPRLLGGEMWAVRA